MSTADLPVVVIGGGPVGLAAAAHLLERGENPMVVEAGPEVGHAVRQWGHVRMFSPWEYNIDKAAGRMLRAAGWNEPAGSDVPTGGELVERYIEPLAALPQLRDRIVVNRRVTGVARHRRDKVHSEGREAQPFQVRFADADRPMLAKAVIDATGTWAAPNPAGADGLPAYGEEQAAGRIAYGIPDVIGAARRRYSGRTIIVLGSGHSALNVLIDLASLRRDDPAMRIIWAMRKGRIEAAFGGEAADQLPARGALGIAARQLLESGTVEAVHPFRAERIERNGEGRLVVIGAGGCGERRIVADEMIVATGFRPDLSFLREIRLTLDPWLESSGSIGPLIDPNLHSCGTVRPHGARELAHAETGFYIAGMKSYGRAPTFLLATGHEQVRSIAAALTGDIAAAERVELSLPETGVCSARPVIATAAAACCGPKAPEVAVSACCAPKEEVLI